MSPISMLWGTECLSMSLTEGELGVLVVDGAPRVRVNSPLSREAAIASGVNPEFMIETFSACRGESDWWIGVISGISSLFILFIIEPFCGNRRDSKSGKCPGCVLCSRVGAGQETLNITFPWRSILYLLLGGASAGTAPTAIPACGLLVASVMHMVAACKGEHGNANPKRREKKKVDQKEKKKEPCCGSYYFPSILRCGLCGTARGLWDGRNDYLDDDAGRGRCRPCVVWCQMEMAEKSNIGKWTILGVYAFINIFLFSQRFNVMISSGALVGEDVLRNVTNPKASELNACDPTFVRSSEDWPTFACPSTGETPAPPSSVRAFCEAQLSEQATDSFESVHIGQLDGNNIQPTPVQTTQATGIAWIVIHSPTSISYRVEASSLTGPPVAVHLHGPASALGAQIGADPPFGQGATGPSLLQLYMTNEYTGNKKEVPSQEFPISILGERSQNCPVIGKAGEELRCEEARMNVHSNVTTFLRRGRVYLNVHTQAHPKGEIRANLRETFVSILDSPQRDSASDQARDATGGPQSGITQQHQGQGVATLYLLDDGVDFVRLPSVDFSILVGNLLPGQTGQPAKVSIVREELSKVTAGVATGTTADENSGETGTTTNTNVEVLQYLCADPVAGVVGTISTPRGCSTGTKPGCYGNAPPDGLPKGVKVLAGGGTAAKTTSIGICGPFTPLPLASIRTPTGRRTNVGGGAIYDLATDKLQTANETIRSLRTKRAALHVDNKIQGRLVSGMFQSAVAIAYALPPLSSQPWRLTGSFAPIPGNNNATESSTNPAATGSASGSASGTTTEAPSPFTAAGVATVRLISPRSFAYVLELYELSGVPTKGIFIRGPGTRARSKDPQLIIHTIASVMVGNGTEAVRAATQECELVSAALTVCAGTVDNVDEAMISALLQGMLYIDVRTDEHPYGELRAAVVVDRAIFGGGSGSGGGGTCSQPLARNLGLSYGGAWAKAFGQMLNFNCALVLYPVLRYILRRCQNHSSQQAKGGIASWIPFHLNIDFHKLIAVVIGLCTAGHILAHFLNYGKSPDATIARFHWHSWVTGAIITFSMLFIFSGGQSNVKRAHYELFLNTHRSFFIFFIALILHGPSFYLWGLAGMILYILELVIRRYRGSHHFFVRSIRYIPPVMQLKFRPRHADEFRFLEGQYLYLNCPYVSKNEWHPFTISSAIGDLDQGGEEGWVSVHIRIIPGGWTENTLRYFCAMNGRDLNEDDLKNELFLNLTSRDAKGDIQIGKDRGVDGKPLLLVDGPHAAPAQHYSTYDHVMMVGAGIGLTPSCSVLRSVLKYKWKKGWKPTLLRFYWVVRHSEIDSFLWFLEQLVQLEKEILADRSVGTIRNIHIFEANVYITRAPKPEKCTSSPAPVSDHVKDLLLSFQGSARRSNSVTRGLLPSPLVKNHTGIDMVRGGGEKQTLQSKVSQAGMSQMVDLGYDIETLYGAMHNPTVASKNQTVAQQPQNVDMAENRLGNVWIWNGRPDWNQIFDQNANTPYVTTGIGVAFCGTPFIGKDLSKYCRIKSNAETGRVFHLLKENF